MSIDELKKDRLAVLGRLHIAVAPLRRRLARFGFLFWWGRVEYMLALDLADQEGVPLHLTDDKYDELMAMSDDELRAYCIQHKENIDVDKNRSIC